LDQPSEGIDKNFHISPIAGFYHSVLDYAKYHDGRYYFEHPVPKHYYRPKDEVKKEQPADEVEIMRKEPIGN
jgi:hypothetical protein